MITLWVQIFANIHYCFKSYIHGEPLVHFKANFQVIADDDDDDDDESFKNNIQMFSNFFKRTSLFDWFEQYVNPSWCILLVDLVWFLCLMAYKPF